MAFGTPPVPMGYIGYCQFDVGNISNGLIGQNTSHLYQARVTSCDLKLSQEVNKPNVYDIFYDRNVIQYLPEKIEGSIEYPVVINDTVRGEDPTETLWNLTARRNYYGRLDPFNILVKHSNINSTFRFLDCYVNTFNFNVKAEDIIRINVNIFGKSREFYNFQRKSIPNGKIATWDNAIVALRTPQFSVGGEYIRQFEVTVNNSLERYYTSSGRRILQVKDISPRNRDIDGKVVLMGRHPNLAQYSLDNPARCYEYSVVEFGYQSYCVGCSTSACAIDIDGFLAKIPNVVFRIEEISLADDIFETAIDWTSLPADNEISTISQGVGFVF